MNKNQEGAVQAAVKALEERLGAGGGGMATVVELGVLLLSADGVIDADELRSFERSLQVLVGDLLREDIQRALISGARSQVERLGVRAQGEKLGAALRARNALWEGLALAAVFAATSAGVGDAEREALEAIGRGGAAEAEWVPECIRRAIQLLGAAS